MKAHLGLCICWLAVLVVQSLIAQTPLAIEPLKKEIALQKLRVEDNVALRQYFTKAGFKESDGLEEAKSYRGTDTEGDFQMDVVAKRMEKPGQKILITTVEFRQGGKVTVLTAANDASGGLANTLWGHIQVFTNADATKGAASCMSAKVASNGLCQDCYSQTRLCILSDQPIHMKIEAIGKLYASLVCKSCRKTGLLSVVFCLFSA